MYPRTLNLVNLLKKKSFFLLGPRATGKSFLINQQLKDVATVINLLEAALFYRLSANPSLLREIIDSTDKKIIVIDEFQRIPELLNEVHHLIESTDLKFLLTGSSARKLRQKNVNLLAGRAWQANLFPLTFFEIDNFDLMRYLQYGGLPFVYDSEYPQEELDAYINTYLREEIQAEQLVRKIPAFARFLELSATTSGQMLNFSNIASDIGVAVTTIKEYYEILEDTLLGFRLPVYNKTVKRKHISTAKFYYFDTGVKNSIMGLQHFEQKSSQFGEAFEHFLILEMRAMLSYRRIKSPISFWRTRSGHEVDLLIGDQYAIEIKSTNKVTDKHLKGLIALMEENLFERYFLVSLDPINRKSQSGIEILYWKDFLNVMSESLT